MVDIVAIDLLFMLLLIILMLLVIIVIDAVVHGYIVDIVDDFEL